MTKLTANAEEFAKWRLEQAKEGKKAGRSKLDPFAPAVAVALQQGATWAELARFLAAQGCKVERSELRKWWLRRKARIQKSGANLAAIAEAAANPVDPMKALLAAVTPASNGAPEPKKPATQAATPRMDASFFEADLTVGKRQGPVA